MHPNSAYSIDIKEVSSMAVWFRQNIWGFRNKKYVWYGSLSEDGVEPARTGCDKERKKKSIHQKHLRHASYSNSIPANSGQNHICQLIQIKFQYCGPDTSALE